MTDLAERVFERSYANDPTPDTERTTASLLDELNVGCDALRSSRIAAEILERCNEHYNREGT